LFIARELLQRELLQRELLQRELLQRELLQRELLQRELRNRASPPVVHKPDLSQRRYPTGGKKPEPSLAVLLDDEDEELSIPSGSRPTIVVSPEEDDKGLSISSRKRPQLVDTRSITGSIRMGGLRRRAFCGPAPSEDVVDESHSAIPRNITGPGRDDLDHKDSLQILSNTPLDRVPPGYQEDDSADDESDFSDLSDVRDAYLSSIFPILPRRDGPSSSAANDGENHPEDAHLTGSVAPESDAPKGTEENASVPFVHKHAHH
jgi:hypothetical protein